MSGKILVVDDDPHALRLMSYVVQWAGYEVLTAEGGDEAWRAIQSEHPALVIVDLVMPGVNGFQICQRIRANPDTAHIKIIAVTGVNTPENRRRSQALGADDYVAKPLDVEEFLEKISRLVADS